MKTANKIIFILAWLLWLFTEAVGAQDTIWIQFDGNDSVMVRTEGYQYQANELPSLNLSDCQFKREETPWHATKEGTGQCVRAFAAYHEWVDAEYDDVNPRPRSITYAVYYPCGSPWEAVFARICSKCGREERRETRYWYELAPKPESEFKQLQKQFHGSGN
jgi:hypothetical protein